MGTRTGGCGFLFPLVSPARGARTPASSASFAPAGADVLKHERSHGLRTARCFTRGYNPPPRWGGSVNSRPFPRVARRAAAQRVLTGRRNRRQDCPCRAMMASSDTVRRFRLPVPGCRLPVAGSRLFGRCLPVPWSPFPGPCRYDPGPYSTPVAGCRCCCLWPRLSPSCSPVPGPRSRRNDGGRWRQWPVKCFTERT